MNGNHRCGDRRSVVLQQRLDAIQPARAPTKYELTINLKTAKALGLTVPSLLVRAAEVMKMSPTSGIGRYCCKSRKSDSPKNLAKVDLWTSLLPRRFSTPLRRSVLDFGRSDMVPHVAAR